jgi:long-chain acyl-CoA synthetase
VTNSLVLYLKNRTIAISTRTAVLEVDTNKSLSYAELWSAVEILKINLRNLGLHAGDRVALALPNGIDWIVSFLAASDSGAIIVPIRPTSTSFDIKRIISLTQPVFFIGDSDFINNALPFDLLNREERVVIVSNRLVDKKKNEKKIYSLSRLSTVKTSGMSYSILTEHIPDVASITFTSRGLGYSLGAMLTHENYINGIKAYIHSGNFYADEVFLSNLPFSYVYPLVGCVLTPLAIGAKIVTGSPNFPHRFWDFVASFKVSVITGVPSMYAIMLHSFESCKNMTESIRHAFCGGSLMSRNLFDQVKNVMGLKLRQGYGLTECLPVTCNPAESEKPESLGVVSRGVPGMRISIEDKAGASCASNQIGEIVIHGPTVMKGYYKRPSESGLFLKEGALLSGDLGFIDSDGFLHYVGLKKRIAKVAGNMVDLLEVEKLLLRIPSINSAHVFAVPDERWGQVVAADVVSGSNEDVDLHVLRRFLKQYLPTHSVPRILRKIA